MDMMQDNTKPAATLSASSVLDSAYNSYERSDANGRRSVQRTIDGLGLTSAFAEKRRQERSGE